MPAHEHGPAIRHLDAENVSSEPLSEARPDDGLHYLTGAYTDRVDASVLDRFLALKVVVTRSDGHDHLDTDACAARGVHAYHLGDYAAQDVAHHALLLSMALLRRLPEASARTRQAHGAWERDDLVSMHLNHSTVGVLGTGRIGSRLVRMLRALDVDVAMHDLAPDAGLESLGARYVGGLGPLLEASDVLVVCVPLDDQTRGMVGADQIKALGNGHLVNVARGAIVDQDAVARALQDGSLRGYAADVLPGDPDPPDVARFAGLPTALVTPHVAAYSEATIEARYQVTKEILEAEAAGRAQDVGHLRLA